MNGLVLTLLLSAPPQTHLIFLKTLSNVVTQAITKLIVIATGVNGEKSATIKIHIINTTTNSRDVAISASFLVIVTYFPLRFLQTTPLL